LWKLVFGLRETYTPRPFWGRGAQGASEGSIRGRKVVLAQHGHAAQHPFFGKYIPPQDHGSANFNRSTQNRLWRENTRYPGSNDVLAPSKCGPSTSITAENGECVAKHSAQDDSTPVAIWSEHARKARLGEKRWTLGYESRSMRQRRGEWIEYYADFGFLSG
jgi:hypothetical protein